MNTVLIAGAGQLGSRHLQGVKSANRELDIWVYDLCEESLQVAEERYDQVSSNNKTAHFVRSLEEVPQDVDIAIVASGSKPRACIITQILTTKNVRYMVLEKFLFTKMSEYDEISDLLKDKNVDAWVNCPRRMWEGYSIVSQYIDKTKPVIFTYEDTDWGLCCNSVHYIDIFMSLCGCNKLNFCIDNVIPEVLDSKRAGYIELRGTEYFETENGSMLTLSSVADSVQNTAVKISNGDNIFEYDEGSGVLVINGERKNVAVHYQSGLSGILVDELLGTGNCRLSKYNDSSFYHKVYLKTIIPFVNRIKGWNSDSCPIT